jgi:hypothetical protein
MILYGDHPCREACRLLALTARLLHCRASDRIAVGTQVTLRPPHRSVRAQLRHTAPILGGDGRSERAACRTRSSA